MIRCFRNLEEERGLAKKLTPIHPGEILLEDFLKPMGVSQYRIAMAIGVPPRRINEIAHGKRAITADTALRLSRYFGTLEALWLTGLPLSIPGFSSHRINSRRPSSARS
jgi:addiction module HigA family antidote